MVADSSFYLCFLEDIESPQYLLSMLSQFDFVMPSLVLEEVRRCRNYRMLGVDPGIKLTDPDFESREILRPLFSADQWRKGEAESIALAHSMQLSGVLWKLILDDTQARTFVERILPSLSEFMTGTLGFIAICYETRIFSQGDSLTIIALIEKSPFRTSGEVLSTVRRQIQGL